MHRHSVSRAVILVATVAFAAAVHAVQPTSVDRLIADVDARLDAALAARDRGALEALLSDGFVMIHSLDGRLDSRAFFLDQASRGLALQRQRVESATFHAP